jgi:hypothetical protein
MQNPTHYVLIVANRTASTPGLLERVRERSFRGPCDFTLLVPACADDAASSYQAAATLRTALPLLEQAAQAPVKGLVGPPDAVAAVKQAVAREHFDEVLVSTLPEPVSAWRKQRMPERIARPWLPVAVVEADSHAPVRGSDGAPEHGRGQGHAPLPERCRLPIPYDSAPRRR